MLAYKSLCPSAWTSRWDDQRGESFLNIDSATATRAKVIRHEHSLTHATENGNFPVRLDQ
jgi:hypothetical protein